MSVLVVGANHRSAELSVLERLAVPADETRKALRSLLDLEHVLEAVVLSTCNRVEVYAHVSRFHPGLAEVRGWLADRGGLTPDELDDVDYSHFDEQAAIHLFGVSGGLDSMIVGERQIALQVRDAMEVARHEGAARRVLQRLFRQAVRVGRKVRNDTDIMRGASSMVEVGLDLAAEAVGGLAGRTVLVVGAGKIGGLTADRLTAAPVGAVEVWNRSEDKAARLAARVGGRALDPAALGAALARADVAVCTTGAPEPVVDLAAVRAAVADRPADRPLVLLDLAMPRNVDPACADLHGVTLLDVTHVRGAADRATSGEVVEAARAIVVDEAHRFVSWSRALEVDPTIRAFRQRAEEVRREELGRLSARLSGLDERQREALEAVTRGIVNTLLHTPTIRLKDLAEHGGAEHYANALRELFDLDE